MLMNLFGNTVLEYMHFMHIGLHDRSTYSTDDDAVFTSIARASYDFKTDHAVL